MSEPTSDALFGNDGTWSPEPLPDPQSGLGRGTCRDAFELPPLPLPPIPDPSARWDAFATVPGDDTDAPAGVVQQDPAAVPDADAPKVDVPQASAAAPTVRLAATEAEDSSPSRRPQISGLFPSALPRPRRPAALRYRPPLAGTSHQSGPGTDPRRRIRRERVDLPLRSRSDGGATAFFLTILIIMGVLIYYIITGFLNSLASFLP